MKTTLITITLCFSYFQSLSRERASLFFSCIHCNLESDSTSLEDKESLSEACGIYYFDPSLSTASADKNRFINLQPAKYCSTPTVAFANFSEIISLPFFTIAFEKDFKIIGKDYGNEIFDVFQFSHLIPENWESVKVELEKDANNNVILTAYEVIGTAPYYNASTSITYTLTYEEILTAYQAHVPDPSNQPKIIATPIVDFKFLDDTWSRIELIRLAHQSPIDGHAFITFLKVYTMDGKLEETVELTPENKIVDFSALRKGIYIFTINTDGIESTQKFEKTR